MRREQTRGRNSTETNKLGAGDGRWEQEGWESLSSALGKAQITEAELTNEQCRGRERAPRLVLDTLLVQLDGPHKLRGAAPWLE